MTKYPTGRVMEVGTLEFTGGAGILIESDIESLKGSCSVIYRECLVIPKCDIEEGVIVAFDRDAKTVTVQFDVMPIVTTGGNVRVVR